MIPIVRIFVDIDTYFSVSVHSFLVHLKHLTRPCIWVIGLVFDMKIKFCVSWIYYQNILNFTCVAFLKLYFPDGRLFLWLLILLIDLPLQQVDWVKILWVYFLYTPDVKLDPQYFNGTLLCRLLVPQAIPSWQVASPAPPSAPIYLWHLMCK